MEENLESLLNGVSEIDSNSDFRIVTTTYNSSINVGGVEKFWNIPQDNLQEFWTGYCKLVHDLQNCDENEDSMESDSDENFSEGNYPKIEYDPYANVSASEIVTDTMPLLLEFTLSFPKKVNRTYHDEIFLQKMCRALQYTIMESCILNENQDELTCCVMESSVWDDKNLDSVKFRFQFPYCVLDPKDIKGIVRENLLEFLKACDPLSSLLVEPTKKNWSQIIDTFGSSCVSLYGSDQYFKRPKIQLSHIWRKDDLSHLDSNSKYIPENIEEISFESIFDPRYHDHSENDYINSSVFFKESEDFNENIDYNDFSDEFMNKKMWLPLLFSVNYRKEQTDINIQSNQDTIIPSNKIFSIPKSPETNDDPLYLCETLIPLLDPSRYQSKMFWLDIVKAINSSAKGHKNGLPLLINFTRKAISNFKIVPTFYKEYGSLEDTCKSNYYLYNKNPITVKTIAFHACNDNPELYGEWHRNWCIPSMERALSGLDADVGTAFYKIYWLKYACTDFLTQKWYEFDGVKWNACSGGTAMRKEMMYGGFRKYFEKEKFLVLKKQTESSDENFIATAKRVETQINILLDKIKTMNKNGSFLKATALWFEDKSISDHLDMNPYLTPVRNGIMEIFKGDLVFRAAKPEDYVSLCTNVNFEKSYSWEHPLVKECFEWLHKVFPDQALLHHFLKFGSSGLIGLNIEKLFAIWTGKGHNSKSMIIKLFEAVFGVLCINFPVELLTGKDGFAAGPSPHIARAKSTRFAFVTETDDDKVMNKGTIKKYTGGDSFYARLLNENGGDIKSTFKMVLVCNNVPTIPNADDAVRDRTRLFPFDSTWVKRTDDNLDEQFEKLEFQRDTEFETKIPALAPAFFWIICEYYAYYAAEGMADIPEIVRKKTQSYWEDSDHYAHYISDCVEQVYLDDNKTLDDSVKSTLAELHDSFKNWFKISFPMCVSQTPNVKKFKEALSKRWGEPIRKGWRGIRIITDTDNSANDGDFVNDDDGEEESQNVAKLVRDKIKGKYMADVLLKHLINKPISTINVKDGGVKAFVEKKKSIESNKIGKLKKSNDGDVDLYPSESLILSTM